MPNKDIQKSTEYQQNNYHTQFNYHFTEHQKLNESGDTEALKSLFRIALETRNFEIMQLVQRNNFFMIFQGVAFAGLAQSSHTVPVVSFMLCLAGLLVSLYQTGMASGAKFWQEYWEAALSKIERNMLKYISDSEKERKLLLSLFHNDQDSYNSMVRNGLRCKGNSFTGKLIMRRFSVSKIPILVGVSLSIIWLLLLLCTLRAYPPLGIPSFIIGL
ncbi:RipA family octameric membrane protein [Aeromonas salmonicida]|uniref:RipA family octameric membrane protein n=1 Tax=Aeromonas salmonicida TaxID=645 RepID=UPI00285EF7B3|nr:hypothetical protein [Aeromonas salmonicida]MDR7021154.1 hypothetical protein [Aeromonas salmonicida]